MRTKRVFIIFSRYLRMTDQTRKMAITQTSGKGGIIGGTEEVGNCISTQTRMVVNNSSILMESPENKNSKV